MATSRQRKHRETFGALRRLPSLRWQASYLGPDGIRRTAPTTFDNQTDARGWLAKQRAAIMLGTWRDPDTVATESALAAETVAEHAHAWIENRVTRTGDLLRARTREEYTRLVDNVFGALGDIPFLALNRRQVETWHRELLRDGTKTTAARAYSLLRAIYATAVEDGVLTANPVFVKGAANSTTGKQVAPPTSAQLGKIVDAMPARYRAAVLVAAWGGLRYGELTELRRKDLDRTTVGTEAFYTVRIERAVVRTAAGHVVGPPKSAAGLRTVTLPPHVTAALDAHLDLYVGPDRDALLFPNSKGGHLTESSFTRLYYPARAAAGRDDMPWHALRHYGATRYALTGATTREIQERLGHSTHVAAMRYQHTAGRDLELARRLSEGEQDPPASG